MALSETSLIEPLPRDVVEILQPESASAHSSAAAYRILQCIVQLPDWYWSSMAPAFQAACSALFGDDCVDSERFYRTLKQTAPRPMNGRFQFRIGREISNVPALPDGVFR